MKILKGLSNRFCVSFSVFCVIPYVSNALSQIFTVRKTGPGVLYGFQKTYKVPNMCLKHEHFHEMVCRESYELKPCQN